TVLGETKTDRLMVFNGVMLDEMVEVWPATDVLTGRPLPAVQVADFVRRHANNPAPAAHPQWLTDSPRRIAQYAEIARATEPPMRINLEIAVGLHRGGRLGPAAVAAAIDLIKAEPLLMISGLMGYEPHVVAAADPAAAEAKAQAAYGAALEVLAEKLEDVSALTLNTAGSPTFALHADDPYANEVSIGSAFV